MSRLLWLSCFVTYLNSSATALAGTALEPLRLAPASKWQVEYADDSCRLARRFGGDKQATTIFLDSFGPGQAFRLTVLGPSLARIYDDGAVSLQFGPDEPVQEMFFYRGRLGSDPAIIISGSMRLAPLTKTEEKALTTFAQSSAASDFSPALISSDRIEAVNELVIGKPLKQPLRLMLGSMTAPFAAMDKCIGELMTHWGVDLQKYATQSRPPRFINKEAVISDEDYPKGLAREGRRSIVNVRLSVDVKGMPTACHVQQSAGDKKFDDVVCKAFMQRARFEPALDAEGNPFASFVRTTVNFRM